MRKTIRIKLSKEEYEMLENIIYLRAYLTLKAAVATKDETEREKITKECIKINKLIETIQCQIDKKRLYW